MTVRTVTWLFLAGCYPSLEDTLDPGPTEVAQPSDGVRIDATDYDVWVGLDLDTLAFVDDASASWDLAARRFEVKLNGGVSGDGGVEVADVDPDAPGQIPAEGWYTDEPDADGDGVPEYALQDWYLYDYETHELSPAPQTWLVRTTEGGIVELAFASYYDDAGTPARILLSVTER